MGVLCLICAVACPVQAQVPSWLDVPMNITDGETGAVQSLTIASPVGLGPGETMAMTCMAPNCVDTSTGLGVVRHPCSCLQRGPFYRASAYMTLYDYPSTDNIGSESGRWDVVASSACHRPYTLLQLAIGGPARGRGPGTEQFGGTNAAGTGWCLLAHVSLLSAWAASSSKRCLGSLPLRPARSAFSHSNHARNRPLPGCYRCGTYVQCRVTCASKLSAAPAAPGTSLQLALRVTRARLPHFQDVLVYVTAAPCASVRPPH